MTELPVAFLHRLRALEGSYLRETDPIRQSGFGGGPERWRTERALVLDAVPDDGDFLDVGCANGYLLECLVQWGDEQHVRLTPYGVDCQHPTRCPGATAPPAVCIALLGGECVGVASPSSVPLRL